MILSLRITRRYPANTGYKTVPSGDGVEGEIGRK